MSLYTAPYTAPRACGKEKELDDRRQRFAVLLYVDLAW
jgi:hypothetical protein